MPGNPGRRSLIDRIEAFQRRNPGIKIAPWYATFSKLWEVSDGKGTALWDNGFAMMDNLERRYAAMTAATDQGSVGGREPAEGERQQSAATLEAAVRVLPPQAARMVAVEVLLANPEALEDDVLEACLYVLREKLRAAE